jgi:hypothetical protein
MRSLIPIQYFILKGILNTKKTSIFSWNISFTPTTQVFFMKNILQPNIIFLAKSFLPTSIMFYDTFVTYFAFLGNIFYWLSFCLTIKRHHTVSTKYIDKKDLCLWRLSEITRSSQMGPWPVEMAGRWMLTRLYYLHPAHSLMKHKNVNNLYYTINNKKAI